MKGNTVSITGNATRDAEYRQTQTGRTVAEFGLAWNASRKTPQGGFEDVPHYFDVKMWLSEGQAGAIPPIVKGMKVAVVDGHLAYESWQGQDGQKRSKVVVMVDDPIQGLVIGAPRQQRQAPQQPAPQAYAPQQVQPQAYAPQQAYQQQPVPQYAPQASIYDEEIPF